MAADGVQDAERNDEKERDATQHTADDRSGDAPMTTYRCIRGSPVQIK